MAALLGAHQPVMVAEVLEQLALAPGMAVVDGTLGLGGHLLAMLERIGPTGRALAFELDPAALATVAEALGPARLGSGPGQVQLVHGSFAQVRTVVGTWAPAGADALLLDLGVSRDQLISERFSFTGGGELDGRLDPTSGEPAWALLARWRESELERVLTEYGEEPFARRIARAIVEFRQRTPLRTAEQLVQLVVKATPPGARHGRVHVATRTFQALRIAVNDMLGALDQALLDGPASLRPGGRMGVLSYHSLEDRRVKLAWRELARAGRGELVTAKPLPATRAECLTNPSARSAKLRVLAATAETRSA